MSPHAIYLHGFGSSPLSAKATAVGRRIAGAVASYTVPQLDAGDFGGMTMSTIAARAEAAVEALPDDGAPVLLVGSSLGGYTAAQLMAQRRAQRVRALVLIAPAFGFPSYWREKLGPAEVEAWRRNGERPFFHHAAERELPLGFAFYESCVALPDLPAQAAVPTVIVHGRQDETVDHRWSVDFARGRERVELHLVQGDHRLTEARHEDLIAWCAHDQISRMGHH
jgi:pimeloyl-ACP methyl ester carboxylesterase